MVAGALMRYALGPSKVGSRRCWSSVSQQKLELQWSLPQFKAGPRNTYAAALGDRFVGRVLPDSAANTDVAPFFARYMVCPHSVVVALPVSWTREGDITLAPPPSIVDPDVTGRSRFIGHAAMAAARAPIGV
jgi:hypothetical protein